MTSERGKPALSMKALSERLEKLERRLEAQPADYSNLITATATNLLSLTNDLAMKVWQLEQAVNATTTPVDGAVADRINRARLTERRVKAHLAVLKPAGRPELDPSRILSIGEQWRQLESAAPLNFRTYQQAFHTGARSYQGLPDTSCSVDTHREAAGFRDFLSPYLVGNILDIGCGPQAVPSYLAEAEMAHVWGIDPLPPQHGKPHPFRFTQGFGEFLPFADNTFDLAISGTTVDHYYLLDRGLKEAHRVLRSGGVFAVWISLIEGSPAYDPYSETIIAQDEEHLYHIDPAWFLPSMSEAGFSLLERMEFSSPFRYNFFAFTKRAG
jgi:ubiquinone/menaquinone biosynthesis C-methylase UbiE